MSANPFVYFHMGVGLGTSRIPAVLPSKREQGFSGILRAEKRYRQPSAPLFPGAYQQQKSPDGFRTLTALPFAVCPAALLLVCINSVQPRPHYPSAALVEAIRPVDYHNYRPSFANMSLLPPVIHNALSQLLIGLASPENELRTQAEEQLNTEWVATQPDILLMGLVEMQQLQDAQVHMR